MGEEQESLPATTRVLKGHQRQAAMLEAFDTHTREEISEAVGVSVSAIKRWRSIPEYKDEVEKCRKGLVGAQEIAPVIKRIRADVASATIEAVKTLVTALKAENKDGLPSWHTRLRAAEALLGKGGAIIGTDQPSAGGGQAAASASVLVAVKTEDGGKIVGADVVDGSAEPVD